MGNPQHDALLAQLEPICAEFEQKVIFNMGVLKMKECP
jgi:hypothetical protein